MLTILQIHVGLNQTQKRFVHHGSRLKGMATSLGTHVTARQAAHTVLSQAQWMPVTGLPGITGVMTYIPPGRGVIFPA